MMFPLRPREGDRVSCSRQRKSTCKGKKEREKGAENCRQLGLGGVRSMEVDGMGDCLRMSLVG